jgi:uncharacterized protein
MLSVEELKSVLPAETSSYPSPVPAQIVSSDEYMPSPQNARQREYEHRIKEYGARMAKRLGTDRRTFFKSAAGMAASFLAMNDTWGPVFGVSRAEAQTPELADARAAGLKSQFIMDMHTHFLRDDTRIMTFVNQRAAVGKSGWNPMLVGKEQTLDNLKFANYFKEVFMDSDTKVACITGAPSEVLQDWFLTNEMKADARNSINKEAGTRRALAHAIFAPGYDGWMDQIDHALAVLKPDSMKGYTVGDNTNKNLSKHPWRLDDEKLLYPAYEKFVKAGIKNVCVHKGLFPPSVGTQFPNLLDYADVRDVGKAARDWPQLNFIVYHSAYRWAGGGKPEDAWEQFQKTGRLEWVSELAEIPEKYGVTNVYGDLGQIFAWTVVAEPRLGAAVMGILGKGLGYDHVVWGTDAVWTGAPQWQIEGLRRLEIPEDMQRRYGFKPLGAAADSPIKNMIFGGNNARLYNYTPQLRAELLNDRFAVMKTEYDLTGEGRTNMRYGYVSNPSRAG